MQRFLKVKDRENLVKDMSTGAILNTDPSAILRHEKRLREMDKEKHREDEINSLKSDISEIKALLKALLEKG